MSYRQPKPKDNTLKEIGGGLAILGGIILAFGDWSTGAQYIGAGFVMLGALVIIIDRLIRIKEDR